MKKIMFGASGIVMLAVLGIVFLSGEKPAESAVITIDGVSCNNCVERISTALSELDGVVEANVSLGEGIARVNYDPGKIDVPAMEASITKLGYVVGTASMSRSEKKEKDPCEATDDCCASKSAGQKT
jgi:copper chaperone CopZ